jgi:hypothetical protein
VRRTSRYSPRSRRSISEFLPSFNAVLLSKLGRQHDLTL